MTTKFKFLKILILGILLSAPAIYAQDEKDLENDSATVNEDLGTVTDSFQENFFEALKQKGIENYELALDALTLAKRAANGDVENIAVVDFERGKNLAALKRYEEAELSFQDVLKTQPANLDVQVALYDVYFEMRDYDKAIPLVKNLIKQDEDYKEDLVNLYNRTKQYDLALTLLDELDETWGESVYRNALRRNIYKVTGNTEGAITNLEEKIDKNPEKEQDYLNLIFLYSEQGDTEKAFITAKELLKNQPKSELVHFALYKFYLEEGNTEAALNSMNIVFDATEIPKESKYKVLADFINFVNENPQYETNLEKVVTSFTDDNSGQVYESLGQYYASKGKKEVALSFYEKGAALDTDNYSLLKNTLLLQIDLQKYDEAITLSEEALGTFPAQAMLYLLNGVANNRLGNSDTAIESLESGLDFLLDDPRVERDFYDQLRIAYEAKGEPNKAASFKVKAAQIKLDN
ncbi:MAG TPA: tetratricopeptide repeat protein [Flavobacteriaceae bacterium]|nr:tetratricopeptide repeat protein [Flavobacteriaceae bacterium]HIN98976.1 tetratricopeptide repeat protein [Flavobacteriaceae bacterium]